MKCSCIKKVFDLHISSVGSNRMVIKDRSIWMDRSEGFDDAEQFIVKITSDVRGIINTIPLTVKGTTILTTKELFKSATEQCIQDQIFCFSTTSCGVDMSITRAYMPNAYGTIQALLARAKDRQDERDYYHFKFLYEQVMSLSEIGMPNQAKEAYKILKENLANKICDCC